MAALPKMTQAGNTSFSNYHLPNNLIKQMNKHKFLMISIHIKNKNPFCGLHLAFW